MEISDAFAHEVAKWIAIGAIAFLIAYLIILYRWLTK